MNPNSVIQEAYQKMLITPELLVEKGYKKFNDPLSKGPSYLTSYQKKVLSSLDNGVLYFINLNYHYLSEDLIKDYPDERRLSIECDLQMTSIEFGFTTNIKFSIDKYKRIEDVENYCMKLFKNMDFAQYEYGYIYSEEQHISDIEAKNVVMEKNALSDLINDSDKKENVHKL